MSSSNNLGLLRYKIRYDHTIGKLHCTVVECKNLPKTDVFGKTDPYVKVFLMPGNHADLKTKSFKKNQNPVFNDEFSFVIDVENAQKKTIVFQVYDKDMVGKDDAIGEVQVPLWLVDMNSDTDKTEILEKPTMDKNKKPILKQKRPNATVRSSSVSSTASSVRESHFDVSGGHRHSAASAAFGGGGLHTSSVSEVTQRSSNGQGFHSSSGGQPFQSSTTSTIIHKSSAGGGGRRSSSSSSSLVVFDQQ
jgi:Ca2+-dependent lipid-binding protein